MKQNIIGIVGVIIAFIGLALPWWTITLSATIAGSTASASIYPYQVATSTGIPLVMDLWYGWAAFCLVVIGGLLGIAGSLLKGAKLVLVSGAVLVLLSVIVFAAGLQYWLSNTAVSSSEWPTGVALFSSGSWYGLGNYTTYLSFGFWLALVGAIIMLAALRWKTRPDALPPPTSPPPAPATTPPA